MKEFFEQFIAARRNNIESQQQELDLLRDIAGTGNEELMRSFLNYNIITSPRQPLPSTITNPPSQPVSVSNMNDLRSVTTVTGKVFGSTTDFLTAGNNQNIVAVLSNPAGSTFNLAISLVTLATLKDVTNQRDIRNGTIAGTLTANTIYNLNNNFGNTSVAAFQSAGGSGIDLTGGTLLATRAFPANTTSVFDFSSAIIIKPGDSYGVKFNFQSGGTAAINIIWEEQAR
ncbi:hypothetical protein AV654_27365 [Paenibacillus elgii]|uniref:Uncharacterized protein n=1 Tax=Paenibacillus elgii TaxID=189691 RepID=A0A165QHY4_9BACL|nr:hypothetical protein [Paenibacillus elgii]KZE75072.1 hypothetical protein AV654_27365 [Paenibacillus elgii]